MTAKTLACSPQEYHADPCARPSLNYSIAKVLVSKSPAHAYLAHPRLGGHPAGPTDDMLFGNLVHDLVLNACGRTVTIDAPDYRTKAAKVSKAEALNHGQYPILLCKMDKVQACANAVDEAFFDLGIKADPDKAERIIEWEDAYGATGLVLCRSMLDLIDGLTIWDLKTCSDASPHATHRKIFDMGYEIQAASYIRAAERLQPDLAGRIKFRWLFIETAPPYATAIVDPSPATLSLGAARWCDALRIWSKCLKDDFWPGYGDEPTIVDPPTWELQRQMSDETGDSDKPKWDLGLATV